MAIEWQMNESYAEANAFEEIPKERAQDALQSALHSEVYWFQQDSKTQPRTDRSADQKPAASAQQAPDSNANHKPDASAERSTESSSDADPSVVRQQLESAIEKKFPREKDRTSILALMETFERRANMPTPSRDGATPSHAGEITSNKTLTPSQVSQTYTEILNLLMPDEKAVVPLEKRVLLAQQVLRHAANPNSIDQGKHNTCIASSLEVRTYTRMPERAAKVVADIALGNSFRTTDGTIIALDNMSMIPDEESKRAATNNGERDYASQIFAVVANNVYWLRTTDGVLNSTPVERGAFRYTQIPDLRRNTYKQGEGGQVLREFDFGERVIDMRVKPYNWVSEKPSVPAENIEEVYAQITGDTTGGFVITAKNKNLQVPNPVESPEQLKERVIFLKERGLLPAILIVNTNNSPWNDYPGIWHAVNIIDYNAKKDQLSMSDQYGKESDRNLKAHDLYKAASGPSGGPPPTLPPFMTRMPSSFPQGKAKSP